MGHAPAGMRFIGIELDGISGRIARLLQQKKEVSLELNITNTFYDDDFMQYDTIAEIPGTDKKDEVVMLGAHLDSWHAGTGAT